MLRSQSGAVRTRKSGTLLNKSRADDIIGIHCILSRACVCTVNCTLQGVYTVGRYSFVTLQGYVKESVIL